MVNFSNFSNLKNLFNDINFVNRELYILENFNLVGAHKYFKNRSIELNCVNKKIDELPKSILKKYSRENIKEAFDGNLKVNNKPIEHYLIKLKDSDYLISCVFDKKFDCENDIDLYKGEDIYYFNEYIFRMELNNVHDGLVIFNIENMEPIVYHLIPKKEKDLFSLKKILFELNNILKNKEEALPITLNKLEPNHLANYIEFIILNKNLSALHINHYENKAHIHDFNKYRGLDYKNQDLKTYLHFVEERDGEFLLGGEHQIALERRLKLYEVNIKAENKKLYKLIDSEGNVFYGILYLRQ